MHAVGVSRDNIAVLATVGGVSAARRWTIRTSTLSRFLVTPKNIADNDFVVVTQVYLFRLRFPACIGLS
jgi:hypothetical protein